MFEENFDIDIDMFFLLLYKCLSEELDVGVFYYVIGGSLLVDVIIG